MSKKIAEGTGALVLDVKVGSGAFMKDADRARELAETMVALGTDAGVHTVALLTDMSTPLGLTAGNALEVRESVEVLAGGGPADVVELTLALAREMLAGAGRDDVDPAEALRRRLGDGRLARDDPRAGRRPATRRCRCARETARRHRARDRRADPARRAARSASPPGGSAPAAPARRTRCRPAPASCCTPSPATTVRAGQPLLTLHTDEPDRFERALAALEDGYDIAPDRSSYQAQPLVIDRVGRNAR